MLIQGLILAASAALAMSSSRSPDDFIGKLIASSTQTGASTNTVSLSEGPDNDGVVSITKIENTPSNGLTSSFTGTSSVNFGSLNSDSEALAVGANTRQNLGVNAAQLPASGMTAAGGDMTGGTNLAESYSGMSSGTDAIRGDRNDASESYTGALGGSDTGLVGSVATSHDGTFLTQGSMSSVGSGQAGMGSGGPANNMVGSTFNTQTTPQTHGTPSVGVPYLPTQTQQNMGGATQYGQGTVSNMVPGSMQYMSAPVMPSQTQPASNQVQSSTTNTGNTWGQRNINPMQNNGMYPQRQFNQGNMYNNNNPYYYNPYANPWGTFGYPAYNNQMYGPGGYNPNSWHGQGVPPPNPNNNMIGGNNNNHMNGGNIAGPPGGNVGGGVGGGYNNPFNSLGAWQAAQTQSWLYPMFLFDLI